MTKALIVDAREKDSFDFGGLSVRWKVDGNQTGERFSVVHHPIARRTLGAPLHDHHNEDELSYVLTGRLTALLGDDVVTAEPGTWVFKPRQQWHTFWNAGETPCEIIEVISPARFEHYFRDVTESWRDMATFTHITQEYALAMRFESVPDLCQRFGLTFPAL